MNIKSTPGPDWERRRIYIIRSRMEEEDKTMME
jgi:hypothetical protein